MLLHFSFVGSQFHVIQEIKINDSIGFGAMSAELLPESLQVTTRLRLIRLQH